MFYLTLPSNSSLKHFPNNTPSHFYTQLPKTIDLNEDYEVGLCEVSIAEGFINIQPGKHYININFHDPNNNKQTSRFLYLKSGSYPNPTYLVEALNRLVEESTAVDVVFSYDLPGNKINMKVLAPNTEVYLSPALADITGFPHGVPDLSKNVYIYSDIVEPRPTGDVMAPLLRTIPLLEQGTYRTYRTFEKPHYLNITRHTLSTVEILLTDDNGEEVSFNNGKTVVTLHFRKKRPDY